MKNLELSDLENISGGNRWLTIGTYIFCTIIIAELFYLQYRITYLLGGEAKGDGPYDHVCISESLYQRLRNCLVYDDY